MSSGRRGAALAGAIALVAALLTTGQLATPAWACACGGIAPPPGSTFGVSQETAIVAHDGGRETVELQLDMTGDGATAGLVIPTPAPATVTAGAAEDVTALQAALVPKVVTVDDWWSLGSLPVLGGAAAPNAGSAPQVLGQVQLGPLQATTLAADDPDALSGWLHDNGFALPDAVTAQLGGYVDRAWSFVALRITGDAPLDGALDPIRLTFASDELVYPMAMSRAATDAQHVRLYVLDEHRVDALWLRRSFSSEAAPKPITTTVWSGPAPGGTDLPGARMTVLDFDFEHPGSEILDDLLLTRLGSDARVDVIETRVNHVTFLGVPVGGLLVGYGVLLGVFVLLGIVIVRRVRRT